MSRVIHARMKQATVLGCYQILEANGLSTKGLRMSTVVNDALEAFIRGAVRKGVIPHTDEKEAEQEMYRRLVGEASDLEFDVLPELIPEVEDHEPAEAAPSPETTEDEPMYGAEAEFAVREIIQAAQRALAPEDQNFERNESDPDTPDEEPQLSPTPPWEASGVKEVEDLREESKDDPILASLDDCSPEFVRATQVVYSKIPREMRGSRKAMDLITKMVPLCKLYIQAGHS